MEFFDEYVKVYTNITENFCLKSKEAFCMPTVCVHTEIKQKSNKSRRSNLFSTFKIFLKPLLKKYSLYQMKTDSFIIMI